MRHQGVAVLGTGTDIGKTVVTAALGLALRRSGMDVTAWKPVATGGARRGGGLVSEDAAWLKRVLSLPERTGEICTMCWRTPVAPVVAARIERRPLETSLLYRRWRELREGGRFVLVEGVGGVLVPLTDRISAADFVRRLGIPAIVVAAAGLGTINHTLLTLEALRARGVPVAGVILNGLKRRGVAERTNPGMVATAGRTRILAVLPHAAGVRAGGAVLLGLARRIAGRAVMRAVRGAR